MSTNKPGRKASGVGHDTPSARARAVIAGALRSEVHAWHLPQAKAAARLGIHRTNLNRLLQGELSRFALGHLIDLAALAGIEIEWTVRNGMADAVVCASPQSDRELFGLAPRDQAKQRYATGSLLEPGGID